MTLKTVSPNQTKTIPMNKKVNHQPFIDHLDELRDRLLRSLAAILLGAILAYIFIEPILRFIIKPIGHLVFTSPPALYFLCLLDLLSHCLMSFIRFGNSFHSVCRKQKRNISPSTGLCHLFVLWPVAFLPILLLFRSPLSFFLVLPMKAWLP